MEFRIANVLGGELCVCLFRVNELIEYLNNQAGKAVPFLCYSENLEVLGASI